MSGALPPRCCGPTCGMRGWAAGFSPGLRPAPILRDAYLRLASLDGADLTDADLCAAEGLTQA